MFEALSLVVSKTIKLSSIYWTGKLVRTSGSTWRRNERPFRDKRPWCIILSRYSIGAHALCSAQLPSLLESAPLFLVNVLPSSQLRALLLPIVCSWAFLNWIWKSDSALLWRTSMRKHGRNWQKLCHQISPLVSVLSAALHCTAPCAPRVSWSENAPP